MSSKVVSRDMYTHFCGSQSKQTKHHAINDCLYGCMMSDNNVTRLGFRPTDGGTGEAAHVRTCDNV